MATGYTAKLHEGTPQTFPEFALSCAHAFGALITLRDAAPDSPIPEEFEPETSYHDDALARAKADLAAAQAMTLEEAERAAQAEFERIRDERTKAAVARAEMAERYEAMLAQARDWQPPTDEHQGLRDFMVQQIEESIRFDCAPIGWPEYPKLSARAWRADRVAKAQRDIVYHTEERDKEIARAESRSKWVRLLRASLPPSDTKETQ